MYETKSFESSRESAEIRPGKSKELFSTLERMNERAITTRDELLSDGDLSDRFFNVVMSYVDRKTKGDSMIAEDFRKAREIGRSKGYGIGEEDIRQEIYLHIFKVLDMILPEKTAAEQISYINTTIHNVVKGQIRMMTGEERDPKDIISLDKPVGADGETTIGELIEDDYADIEYGIEQKDKAIRVLSGVADDLRLYADDLLVVIGTGILGAKPKVISEDLLNEGSVEAVLNVYEKRISEILNLDLGGVLTRGIKASKMLDQAVRQSGGNRDAIVDAVYNVSKHKRVDVEIGKIEGGMYDEQNK